jgi:hypothetical protein
MTSPDRRDALDHVVVVMFENRSFDNLLGRLYQPGEVASFEGSSARVSATRFRNGRSTAPTGVRSLTGSRRTWTRRTRTRARNTSTHRFTRRPRLGHLRRRRSERLDQHGRGVPGRLHRARAGDVPGLGRTHPEGAPGCVRARTRATPARAQAEGASPSRSFETSGSSPRTARRRTRPSGIRVAAQAPSPMRSTPSHRLLRSLG